MGRIKSIRDNPVTQNTDIEVEHELEYLARAVVGDSFWTAKLADGVMLYEGRSFGIATRDDEDTPPTWRYADPLVVVNGAPASVYEISAGRISLTDLISKINTWIATAIAAGDIDGTYSFALSGGAFGATKTRLLYTMPTGASTVPRCYVRVEMPSDVWRLFGGYANTSPITGPGVGTGNLRLSFDDSLGDNGVVYSTGPALRFVNQSSGQSIEVMDESGAWFDQHGIPPSIPATLAGLLNGATPTEGYGVIKFNGHSMIAGAAKSGTSLTLTPLIAPGESDIFAGEPTDGTGTYNPKLGTHRWLRWASGLTADERARLPESERAKLDVAAKVTACLRMRKANLPPLVVDDADRGAHGFEGDCVIRAVTIAMREIGAPMPFLEVERELDQIQRGMGHVPIRDEHGTNGVIIRAAVEFLERRGWKLHDAGQHIHVRDLIERSRGSALVIPSFQHVYVLADGKIRDLPIPLTERIADCVFAWLSPPATGKPLNLSGWRSRKARR